MALRIGIDFDNTIVNYHQSFYQLALAQGFVDQTCPAEKSAVRSHIMEKYGDDQHWQYLQSKVYGENILQAKLFSGFTDALNGLIQKGHQVYIVSHKSEFSHYDASVNLRQHALTFLKAHNIIGQHVIDETNVYFLSTLDEKVEKISALQLDVFIDDLDKVLMHRSFPDNTLGIPFGAQENSCFSYRIEHWQQVFSICSLTQAIGVAAISAWLKFQKEFPVYWLQLKRDGNNQIFVLHNSLNQKLLLKRYFHHSEDKRNRALTEFSACQYLQGNNIKYVPDAVFFNDKAQFAFYQYIESKKPLTINDSDTTARSMIDFVLSLKSLYLQSLRDKEQSAIDFYAADARLSLQDYFDKIDEREKSILAGCSRNRQLTAIEEFFKQEYLPFKQRVFAQAKQKISNFGLMANQPFAIETLTLSPSDFGPHNMLMNDKGCYFIDFEYFGIDDPAKMLADIFHHAQDKLSYSNKWAIFKHYCQYHNQQGFEQRFEVIVDLIALEWLLIVLNIASPGVIERRRFANATLDIDELLIARLNKARAMLCKYKNIADSDGKYLTISTTEQSVTTEKLVS